MLFVTAWSACAAPQPAHRSPRPRADAQRRQPRPSCSPATRVTAAGQIFALAVMVVAAAEAVVGLGLIVALSRRRVELDVDKLSEAEEDDRRRLVALFSPAAAVVARAASAQRISPPRGPRRRGGVLLSSLLRLRVRAPARGDPRSGSTSRLWTWLSAGAAGGMEILVDPLSVFMMLVVSGVGFLIVAYATGTCGGRRGAALPRLQGAVRLLDAAARPAGNLLLLLAGWGLVGLSSYLLINFWHQRGARGPARKRSS